SRRVFRLPSYLVRPSAKPPRIHASGPRRGSLSPASFFSFLNLRHRLVRAEGLEPPHLSAAEPKSAASTNSATPAKTRAAQAGAGGPRYSMLVRVRKNLVHVAANYQKPAFY